MDLLSSDEAGAPLAGAEVRLRRTDGFPTHRRTATSDPQGLVHFEGLFEGQYAWRAAHDTHLFEGGGGVVRVPTGSDGWELVGALGGWIEVATYDVDGAHLDRAPVGLRGPDGYAHAPLSTTGLEFLHYGPNGPELTLSPGDRWLWGPLRAGAYTFTFDSGSGFDVHGVDVEAGRTAVIEHDHVAQCWL